MNRKQYQDQLKHAQQNQHQKQSRESIERAVNEPTYLKIWHVFELLFAILLIVGIIILGWLISQNLGFAMIVIIVLVITLMLFLFCWA